MFSFGSFEIPGVVKEVSMSARDKVISRPKRLMKRRREPEAEEEEERVRRRSFENIRQVVKKTVGMSKERARGFAMVAHPRPSLQRYIAQRSLTREPHASVVRDDDKHLDTNHSDRFPNPSTPYATSHTTFTTTDAPSPLDDLPSLHTPSPPLMRSLFHNLTGLPSSMRGALSSLADRAALAACCSRTVLEEIHTIRSCASASASLSVPSARRRPAVMALARDMAAQAAASADEQDGGSVQSTLRDSGWMEEQGKMERVNGDVTYCSTEFDGASALAQRQEPLCADQPVFR